MLVTHSLSHRSGEFYCSFRVDKIWSTGIRGLMRGMATLHQANQELIVVRDKVERPQVSLE